MSGMKAIRVVDLPLDEIEVGRRVRMLSPAGVNIIAASIEDLGVMTQPIHVRKTKVGYRLIDGNHRYAAAQKLGWQTIPAKVWQCTANEAELMESDANISTAHLTPLELAVSLAARKKTYEKIHPDTRKGHAGASARWSSEMQTTSMSFASWMADLYGVSSRQIERIISCGQQLSHDEVRWLRDAQKPVTMADLQSLAKIDDDSARAKVCIALSNGEAKSAAKALTALKPAPEASPEALEERAFKDLSNAWKRASATVRKRFLTDQALDIYDFLVQEGMLK